MAPFVCLIENGSFYQNGKRIFRKCFEVGCLTRVTGDIIAIAPALIAKRQHIDRLVETIGKALHFVS